MSDFREIEHGFDLLRKCFGDEVKRKLFTEILDTCAPGATNKAIELFDQHLTNIRSSTYIASISEHKSEEDLHGRLSMWRAYCGDAGRVAIVFKVPWHTDKLVMGIDALNIRFGPVVYIGENEFDSIFQQIMFNINESQDFLRFAGFDRISNSIFNMLFMSTLCTKHSGFQEEQEWRIIYCPPVWKPTLKQIEKNLMKSERKVIGGVPQKIIIMPLNGEVDDVLEHFDLAYMFDRLIIGPTQYGWPMLEAFKDALQDIGVEDAHQKVFLSNIPLRT